MRSKVVMNHLKDYITHIMSPYQTRFIFGISIHESEVRGQKMLHSLHNLKGNIGFFVMKADLAKLMID